MFNYDTNNQFQNVIDALSQDELKDLIKARPKVIEYVKEPSDDLAILALNKDINLITLIKNPSEKVQLFFVKKINSKDSVSLFNYIEKPTKNTIYAYMQKQFNMMIIPEE